MLRALSQFAQPPRSNVPNLVVAQRVLDKIAAAAQRYIEDETGEALVGLIVPAARSGVPTVYVLDTISPDESAVRQLHTFQQGDEQQDEIIWWLQENWRVYRETGRTAAGKAMQPKWDVPLRYLGDWHKQPGYMIAPSTGDQMTALDWVDDPENGMDFLIAPIATLGHPSTTITSPSSANFITLPEDADSHMRVDFWYIDGDVRLFQPINPAVYPNEHLPDLPDYPWHLVKPDLMNREYGLLQTDGLFTSVVLWNAHGHAPLDVCLMTARAGADHILILVTPYDYPRHKPTARSAAFVQVKPEDDIFDIFEELWTHSQPVDDPPGWAWADETHLIDYVHALEASVKISAEPVDAEDKP
ncbi:MAG: hypothetical protein K8I30_05955 [Anaerolineae bacterium]|nr:hypothetical protein [Anaerolineae bacterium]